MIKPTQKAIELNKRFVMQTVTGDNGNCMSACLASVLGISIDDVPNFHDTAKDSEDWWRQIRAWLAKRNLGLVSITYDPATFERIGGLLIISGESKRGLRHATVWHNGAMIHDPHPDNTGVEPDTIDLIFELDPALSRPISEDLGEIGGTPFTAFNRGLAPYQSREYKPDEERLLGSWPLSDVDIIRRALQNPDVDQMIKECQHDARKQNIPDAHIEAVIKWVAEYYPHNTARRYSLLSGKGR